MKRAYDEVMEHIQVTEEMRTRILEQLQNTDRRPAARVIPFSALKNMVPSPPVLFFCWLAPSLCPAC